LFNVVTHKKGIPHAVLIRAVEPLKGIDIMMNRRQQTIINRKLTSGPGSLSKAMGIKTDHSGISLLEKHIWLEDDGFALSDSEIGISPRIGVDYAGLDATLPYRFFIKQSKWLSK
jgi:DNA-3-methyladenine glycosylase